MPTIDQALPGRQTATIVPGTHFVLYTPLAPPYPPELEQATFGMGCFRGAARRFWHLQGVYTTADRYAGG